MLQGGRRQTWPTLPFRCSKRNHFPDHFVNLVVNHALSKVVHDKVHEVVIRTSLRQSLRGSSCSIPNQPYPSAIQDRPILRACGLSEHREGAIKVLTEICCRGYGTAVSCLVAVAGCFIMRRLTLPTGGEIFPAEVCEATAIATGRKWQNHLSQNH